MGLNPTYSILWLEDSENDVFIFGRKLKEAGFDADVFHVETRNEFSEAVKNGEWDVILSDYDLPGFSPSEALELMKLEDKDIPFIILSGAVSAEETVRLMRQGAHDFVPKNDVSRLVPAIERELRDHGVRQAKRKVQNDLEERNRQLAETLDRLREAQDDALRLQRLRAVGEMASGIAHDFNNTLMKVSGLISVVSSDLGRGLPLDFHRESFEELRAATDEGKRVMRRVAKFYNSENKDEGHPIDLNGLMKRVVENQSEIWKKGRKRSQMIKVKWQLEEALPEIQSKEADLQEALANLIKNAAEAMPDGGTLTIKTTTPEEGWVELKIIDDGIGMTKEIERRCLEPFFSTKGEFGTGLGLGLADAILQQYGGRLDIKTERWNGTKVRVAMKTAPSLIDPRPGKVSASHQGSLDSHLNRNSSDSLSILLAEDETLISQLVARFLETAGHRVEVHETGKLAFEAFSSEKHDLVISDRSMPEMSGDELAGKIEETSPHTPFIMMTGFGDIMIARGEKPEGVDYVLSKPVDQEAFLRAIDAIRESGKIERVNEPAGLVR